MPKTRILCIGFSVTEMANSYVPHAARICEQENLPYDFHKCGIGGIGLETLAYLLDDIFDMHASFTHIVLEIATGAGRTEFHERRKGLNDLLLLRCIEQIVASALRRGLFFGFLNLPRLDVDYAHDIFELSIFAVAAMHGVPVCSVSYCSLLTGVDLAGFLPDKVHVNDTGAEYYARALIKLAQRGLYAGGPVAIDRKCFSARFLSQSHLPPQPFERHGFNDEMVIVEAGEKVEWSASHAVEFHGITFLSGPSSGSFLVSIDGMEVGFFQAYDQYCYYERYNSCFFDPIRGKQIKVEALADLPDIPLLKGETNVGPRVMIIGRVLYQS